MGTFGEYSGRLRFRNKEELEEHRQQVEKVLQYGGMMKLEEVKLFNKELYLITPVRLEKDKNTSFHFNYFEDDFWETAGYDAETGRLYSGKIGSLEFNDVVTAVNVLCEVKDTEPGVALVNGEPVDPERYPGWLNHLLGTKYSKKKRGNLWANVEQTVFLWERKDGLHIRQALEFAVNAVRGVKGTELADVILVCLGSDEFLGEKTVEGSYPDDILKCRTVVKEYFRNEGSIEELWELLRQSREERKSVPDGTMGPVAEWTLLLPARVVAFLACECRGLEFWCEWKKIYKTVYHDEIMKQYVSKEIEDTRRAELERVVPEVRTSDFLKQTFSLLFRNTPEELKWEPDYYLSDDDRLYWYDGSDEVVVSETVDRWLKELSERHKSWKEKLTGEEIQQTDYIRYLLESFCRAEEIYKRIFLFSDMFYEFQAHGMEADYSAAMKLFDELVEENRKTGELIHTVQGKWDMACRNVTKNKARMIIRRYLAVMANHKLRWRYFGF